MKRIARRLPTSPPVPASSSQQTGRLPDDLLSEQVQRLALLATVGVGLWTFGLMLDTVLAPFRTLASPKSVKVELIGLAVSAAMFLYMRYSSAGLQTKAQAGVWYMLLNAAGIAALNTWALVPTAQRMEYLSWNTILILVVSMISPVAPRRMLIASLAAASMDPLGVWLAHLRGVPVPPPLTTIVLYLPNYVCALVATISAHALQKVGRRLHEAQQMGSYELVELLGHGGMGEVWRARHRLLARHAAIKIVRPELLGVNTPEESQLVLRRFEREAQATAALNSPHTIDIFDYGMTNEGTFYYVMELLHGRDLESLIREFGPIPADRAVFLLRQVCHSMADAHARNLVHRDIKPANIYACRMGLDYDFVKVLDFGLVKKNDRVPQQTLMTLDQRTTGTPAYMAPEVILGDADVDRRADVYSIGCVAYFLLTGQLVFEADTTMKMLMQHVHAEPIPPSQRTELPIPKEVDDLVLACLQKNPDRRPQDAGELFSMACRCTACNCWDEEAARAWWQQHLPDLTGPLTVDESPSSPRARTLLSH